MVDPVAVQRVRGRMRDPDLSIVPDHVHSRSPAGSHSHQGPPYRGVSTGLRSRPSTPRPALADRIDQRPARPVIRETESRTMTADQALDAALKSHEDAVRARRHSPLPKAASGVTAADNLRRLREAAQKRMDEQRTVSVGPMRSGSAADMNNLIFRVPSTNGKQQVNQRTNMSAELSVLLLHGLNLLFRAVTL